MPGRDQLPASPGLYKFQSAPPVDARDDPRRVARPLGIAAGAPPAAVPRAGVFSEIGSQASASAPRLSSGMRSTPAGAARAGGAAPGRRPRGRLVAGAGRRDRSHFAVEGAPRPATGEQIYRAACSTCHGVDGKGAPQQVVGFALPMPNGHGFPDFTDCATNTVEPLADWVAVAQRGGRIRALDRHMPAFGDALSGEQLQQAREVPVELLPGPGVAARRLEPAAGVLHREGVPRERDRVDDRRHRVGRRRPSANELVYEHRLGARGQYEVKVPFGATQQRDERRGTAASATSRWPCAAPSTPATTTAPSSPRAAPWCCPPARRNWAWATASRSTSRLRWAVRCSAPTASSRCTPATRSRPIRIAAPTRASCARRSATP